MTKVMLFSEKKKKLKFSSKNLVTSKNGTIFAVAFERYLSSVVEQWTENPRVPGSIPGGTTSKNEATDCPRSRPFFSWMYGEWACL